jgi:hypothetical protein
MLRRAFIQGARTAEAEAAEKARKEAAKTAKRTFSSTSASSAASASAFAPGTGTPPLTKKEMAEIARQAKADQLTLATSTAYGPLVKNVSKYANDFRGLLRTARVEKSNADLLKAAEGYLTSVFTSGKSGLGPKPTFRELYASALPSKSQPAKVFKLAFNDFMQVVAINNASKVAQNSIIAISNFLVRDATYDLTVARNIESLPFSKTVMYGETAILRQGKPTTPEWAKTLQLHMEHGNSVRNIIYEGIAIYGCLINKGFDKMVIDTVMFDMREQNIKIASDPQVCNPRTSTDNSVAGMVDDDVFQGVNITEAAKNTYDKALKKKGYDALHTKKSFLENKGLTQTPGILYDTPDKYIKAIENYVIHNNTFVLDKWKAYKATISSSNVSSMSPEQGTQYIKALTVMCDGQIKFYSGILSVPVVSGGGTYTDINGYLHTNKVTPSNLSDNYNTLLSGVFAATIINKIKHIDNDDPKFENAAPINKRKFHEEYMAFLEQAYTYFLSYFKTHNFAEVVLKLDELTYKTYINSGKTNQEFLENTLKEVLEKDLAGGTRKHPKHNKTHKHHKNSNKTKKHRKNRKYTLKRK